MHREVIEYSNVAMPCHTVYRYPRPCAPIFNTHDRKLMGIFAEVRGNVNAQQLYSFRQQH